MDFTLSQYLLAAVIVAFASTVQGLVGFAFGLLCVPLLSLLFAPTQAVGINFVLGTVNVLVILVLLIRRVSLRRMALLIALSMACAIPGAFLLKALDRRAALVFIGASISLLAVLSLTTRGREAPLFRHPAFGYGASVLSGFLMGAFTLAGPPMVVYLSNTGMPKDEVKANVQIYFFALTLFILPFYLHTGVLNTGSALTGLALAPVVVPFTALGVFLGRRLTPAAFAVAVNLGLILLGAFMIVKNGFFP